MAKKPLRTEFEMGSAVLVFFIITRLIIVTKKYIMNFIILFYVDIIINGKSIGTRGAIKDCKAIRITDYRKKIKLIVLKIIFFLLFVSAILFWLFF